MSAPTPGTPVRYVAHRPSSQTLELLSTLGRLPAGELRQVLAGDDRRLRLILGAAAEAGLPRAQVLLGRLLLAGRGGPRQEALACEWFRRAAAVGDADACNMLGRCLENGWGVPVDHAQAAVCYRRAAEAGDSWAQYNLGHLHLNGQGVPRDPGQAFLRYRQAAQQGHPRAMNLVGRCYEHGWGVVPDPHQAAAWYRASAQAGYFRGQFNHASVLLELGRPDEALLWLRRAVAQAPPASKALMIRTSAQRWQIDLEG